ncbi:MAG TPA: hypothetical protein VFK50_08745 [Sphingomicrobium sp.]|nr:hypothetical protein [Sphingomicrobium sp.]
MRKSLFAPGDSGLPGAVGDYYGSGGLLAHHAFGPGVGITVTELR